MEQRKYESISGIHKISNSGFDKGDIIHISEKIDGANASFMIDECGARHFFSRNKELIDGDTLRGFTVWAEKNICWDMVGKGYIYYGEWIVQHKIVYNDDVKNTFRLFDIWDIENECYLLPEQVLEESKHLGLYTPDCFYYDEYQGLEHIRQFVGMSNISKSGEGIVIKNTTKGFKCKWVREDFRETKAVKQPKVQNLQVLSLVESFLTLPRIEKFIYKGLDEDVYNSLDVKNYGAIMKYLSEYVIDDIIKEEGDEIPNDILSDFIKICKKRTPAMARKILDKKESV